MPHRCIVAVKIAEVTDRMAKEIIDIQMAALFLNYSDSPTLLFQIHFLTSPLSVLQLNLKYLRSYPSVPTSSLIPIPYQPGFLTHYCLNYFNKCYQIRCSISGTLGKECASIFIITITNFVSLSLSIVIVNFHSTLSFSSTLSLLLDKYAPVITRSGTSQNKIHGLHLLFMFLGLPSVVLKISGKHAHSALDWSSCKSLCKCYHSLILSSEKQYY